MKKNVRNEAINLNKFKVLNQLLGSMLKLKRLSFLMNKNIGDRYWTPNTN